MINLKLPAFEPKIRKNGEKLEIFDPIRKKFLVLTPEEWVRQHFVNFLVHHHHYPKSLIKLEGGLKYNSISKRSDIVVYDRRGTPFMLVECKANDVKLTQKVLEQISVYNLKIGAPYQVITNGMIHYCFLLNKETQCYTILDSLPAFE